MSTLLKIVVSLAGAVLLVLLAVFCWLYFYSRDLPDVAALAQFAPTTITQVNDSCLGKATALSYGEIGTTLRNAINAAEVNEDHPGILRTTFRGLVGPEAQHRGTAGASWVISRTMFC